MATVNQQTKEIVFKIAYHGVGLGGKTTNLREICKYVSPSMRGDLLTLDTATERTLFFDFLLVMLGNIDGYRIYVHLYTLPGQQYYDASRKLILKGSDVIVIVVDSQASKAEENEQSLKLLEQDLKAIEVAPQDIPRVIQYNKADIQKSLSLAELQSRFNPNGDPYHQAIARHGVGVMDTLRTATELALQRVYQ